MKKYNVSVIVPIYNAEKYLDDTIKSLINQTYGFENIELVLVNDGSKDRSLEICKKYKEKYDNIVIVDKENSGVSDTRNTGFKKSTGKYVMFLDSDDLLNSDSIKYLSEFLDENKNVLFVISRVRMFEKTNKWHYMDYRFNNDKKFIDINEDITYSQYHSTGILIRRKAIEDIKFDRNIKYGEDMKFMTQILLKNEVFGKEKRSILYYRKRFDETSACQKQVMDKDFYIRTLEESFKFIFDEVEKKYKTIPKYFQYYILNSLVERFDIDYQNVLSKKELEKYASLFKFFVKKMDDDTILIQKRIGFDQKIYLLKLKHGEKYMPDIDYQKDRIVINGIRRKHKVGEFIKIFNIEKVDKKVIIYLGLNDYLLPVDIYVNDKKIKPNIVKNTNIDTKKYRDVYFNVFYEEKVVALEVDYDTVKTIYFKIGDIKIQYALTKNYLNYDMTIRFVRIKNLVFVFKEHHVTVLRGRALFRSFKYNKKNWDELKKTDLYFDVFVKNGKVYTKKRKIY